MRLRIHHRLFAGFLGVIGTLVVLIVLFAGSGLRRDLTNTFQEELRKQLALGEWIVSASPGFEPDSLARAITARVGVRVTFISEAGVVLGDSYVPRAELPAVENHAERPEIQGAMVGTVTFAQRTSETVGVALLYGAVRVELADGAVVLRMAKSLEEVDRAVLRVQQTVAATGAMAMLVSLALAYLLSMALTRPMVDLADQARRLAQGDFQHRAPHQSSVVEVDELARALNRLTEELASRLTELQRERDEMQALIDCMEEGVIALTDDARLLRTNRAAKAILGLPDGPPFAPIGTLVRHPDLREVLESSVVKPVSAREIQVRERSLLVSSRPLDGGGAMTTLLDVSEIRRLEQVRRDFVANASHELKTPLTSIHGYAETLLDADPPPELRTKFLGSIRDNTERLKRLVDDLLDLSRFESGSWAPRMEPVLVSGVAKEAWASYADQAVAQDVEFTCEAEVRASADRAGLVQVFRNLLENALRHSAGGHVHVSAETGPDGLVVVEVSDDGEGISTRALPRVFERFYRADASRARDFGGTGLGLAIVRHLVVAMGGTVEAESELGRGTTIRLTLPEA